VLFYEQTPKCAPNKPTHKKKLLQWPTSLEIAD